ncbi:hypothetical protein AVEN_61748-1 [Araneus ventricosus]|uniref:Uncharacterized protein n=1 Tax=Araneus ventricosus TaxID=182803 RepID=A0A4Y2VZU8_ARAVE|nr:hypothetical protein AVEN_61748-1 [Araneus ventricosus]
MGEWTSNDENIPKRRQEISSLPTGENTPKQARQVFPYPLKEIKLDMSSHLPQYMDDKFTSKYRFMPPCPTTITDLNSHYQLSNCNYQHRQRHATEVRFGYRGRQGISSLFLTIER